MEERVEHQLLCEEEAAAFLRMSPRTLQGWRYRGIGPAFVRRGVRGVGYLRADLDGWLRARRHRSTSEYEQSGGPS